MPVTSAELWKLLKQSRLLTSERLEQVRIALDQAGRRTHQHSAQGLTRWLLRQQLVTEYQAKVLLSGRAGPFVYGDYQVLDRIRGGRLGGTFRSRHLPSGHPTLLKFASSHIAQDPRQWRVARRYIQTVSPVVHPQLQRVFALVDAASYRFLVLESFDGTSLDVRLKVLQQLDVSHACRIARLVALGLAQLHEHRQVYGDVRPANIWIDSHDHVRLLRDRMLPPSVPELSQPGLTSDQLGQADYMAPELARPGNSLNPATDIYALGCSLYELLQGHPPVVGGNPHEKLDRHAHEPIGPLDRSDVDPALRELVDGMLAKTPAQRLDSASAIADQLVAFIDPAQRAVPNHSVSSSLQVFESNLVEPRSAAPAPPPLLTEPDEHPPIAEPPIQQAVLPPAPPIAHDDGSPSRRRSVHRLRRTRQARRRQAVTLSALASLLLVTAAAAVMFSPSLREKLFGQQEIDRPSAPLVQHNEVQTAQPQPPAAPEAPPTGASQFVQQSDDGQLLWMTPTTGSPIELRFVPPGPQFILIARPHDMQATKSGQQVWQALGPWWAAAAQQWESDAGVSLDQVAQLIATLHGELHSPRACFVVSLLQPRTREQLLAAWGNPAATHYQEHAYYQAHGWSFYIPGDDRVSQFVMGSEPLVRDVIDQQDGPAIVRRQLAQLLQNSDQQRHVTLVFVPDFLAGGPSTPSQSESSRIWQRLWASLHWLLGDNVAACMLCMHFEDPFYVELRAIGQLNQDSRTIIQSVRDRIGQLPEQIEVYLGASILPSIGDESHCDYL